MRNGLYAVACVGFASAVLLGCNGTEQGYREVPKGAKVKDGPHQHEHGPHGGHLVELGEEEYHAEVVYDDKAAKITVYLLDSTAKKPVPIDAKPITLNLKIDGKPVAVEAVPAPEAGDSAGKSSRFEVAGNSDVKSHIKNEEDLHGSVAVTVAGKAYSGEIKHEH